MKKLFRQFAQYFQKFTAQRDIPQRDFESYYYGANTLSSRITTTSSRFNKLALLRFAYQQCPTVYQCVNLIVRKAADLPIELKRKVGDKNILVKDHPFLDLLNQPANGISRNEFIKRVLIDYLIYGEAYVQGMRSFEGGLPVGEIFKLKVLIGHNVSKIPSTINEELPREYHYSKPRIGVQVFKVNEITGKSEILNFKSYDPEDPLYGFSRIVNAANAIDTLVEGLDWNAALLHNSFNMSGTISPIPTGGENAFLSSLNDQQLYDVQESIKKLQGSKKAGQIAVLPSSLKFDPISQTPADMEFQQSIDTASRFVASVFGVPHQMILKGESTYNNYQTANEELHANVIIPLLNEFLSALSRFIDKDEEYFFCVNEKGVEALQDRYAREAERYDRLVKGGLITLNEGREKLGYEPYTIPEADSPMIPSGFIPLEDISIEEAAGFTTEDTQDNEQSPE